MEDRAKFVLESLELIGQTKSNTERVYAFWQINIDKIDALLLRLLPDILSVIFEATASPIRMSIAHILIEFGHLIQEFPFGNQVINSELAITIYRISASFFTQDEYPIVWASIQLVLGAAYWERIEGERKENIELAIQSYQAALEVLTRKNSPFEWAMTQGV
jgi:hypothetical protein